MHAIDAQYELCHDALLFALMILAGESMQARKKLIRTDLAGYASVEVQSMVEAETMANVLQREFPEAPMVGVGAVVVDRERVLLVQRGHEPSKGKWSLPGGILELGESLDARRCARGSGGNRPCRRSHRIDRVVDRIQRAGGPGVSECDTTM